MARFEYPYADLQTAISIAEAVLRHGGKAQIETLADGLKMAVKGGAFQNKVNAAKSFGLLEGKKEVQLTNLARRIVQPINSTEHDEALFEAFTKPSLYNKLWDRFVPNKMPFPGPQPLTNLLIREYHIPQKIADRIAGIFLRSVQMVSATTTATQSPTVTNEPRTVPEAPSETQGWSPAIFVISMQAPGFFTTVTIESDEDWETVNAALASLKRKWEAKKEINSET